MPFTSQTKQLQVAIFDDDDDSGTCAPLNSQSSDMLFGVIHSAFQRSKKKSINVSTVALLSDNAFIARDDATTIRSIIT